MVKYIGLIGVCDNIRARFKWLTIVWGFVREEFYLVLHNSIVVQNNPTFSQICMFCDVVNSEFMHCVVIDPCFSG